MDDDLRQFEAAGAAPLPPPLHTGSVEHEGSRIHYSMYGSGLPVILLHGGLGHSGNWGYQVPAVVDVGFQAILIDSRGHGRSTRDSRPFSYELMASDVLAVMDALQLEKVRLVGWSDGAATALALALRAPHRVAGVFYFGCNMDPSGVKPLEPSPIVDRCFRRHTQAQLSSTPDNFRDFAQAVNQMMETQPNYGAHDLARIAVPVAVVQSENDEFIRREHAEYLARTIPGAQFTLLEGVSHFAPLQRPRQFNAALLDFLHRTGGRPTGT